MLDDLLDDAFDMVDSIEAIDGVYSRGNETITVCRGVVLGQTRQMETPVNGMSVQHYTRDVHLKAESLGSLYPPRVNDRITVELRGGSRTFVVRNDGTGQCWRPFNQTGTRLRIHVQD